MTQLVAFIISSGIITFILGYLFNRGKTNAELQGLELKNLKDTIFIYKTVHAETEGQYKIMSLKYSELSTSYNELSSLYDALNLKYLELNKKVDTLQDLNESLKKEITALSQNSQNEINSK